GRAYRSPAPPRAWSSGGPPRGRHRPPRRRGRPQRRAGENTARPRRPRTGTTHAAPRGKGWTSGSPEHERSRLARVRTPSVSGEGRPAGTEPAGVQVAQPRGAQRRIPAVVL